MDVAASGVADHNGYPGWVVQRIIPRNPTQYGAAAIFSQLTAIVRENQVTTDIVLVEDAGRNYGNRSFIVTRTQEGPYESQYRAPDGTVFPPVLLVPGPNEHIIFIEEEIKRSPAPGVPDFYGIITPGFSTMPIALVAPKTIVKDKILGFALK